MTTVGRIFHKKVWTLGIVVLICCVAFAMARSAGPSNFQLGSAISDSTENCPDPSVQSIDDVNLSGIAAIKLGVRGLPCDAVQEGSPNSRADARKLQHGFDYYSWLTFIALNSPKDGGMIGDNARPDWESFKQLPDVMLPDGSDPGKWSDDNPPLVPPPCGTKFRPGLMIIHMEMEETYNEPFKSGPLFDQNGNYALFVIFMNQQMFEYIRDNHLFSRAGQENFAGQINFPSGDNKGSKPGAIMIKASWKILKKGVEFGANVKSKYHMIDALLYRPHSPHPCDQVKLGLIGFHVGHKTVSRQQWIWTTFEHRDNVPTQQDVDSGIPIGNTYSFYDPECKASDCPVNQTPKGSWDPDRLGWVPFPNQIKFKSQIERMVPSQTFPGGDDIKELNKVFHNDVDALNAAFHNWPQIHGTVWQNYDLVNTQWPSAFPCATNSHPETLPDSTCTPFPAFLANSTLETFSQPEHDMGVPQATSSCISCHNNATTNPTHHQLDSQAKRSDFTYILEKAQ